MPVKITQARRLDRDTKLKPFDCNDPDLNDFFHNDALNHSNELLTVTYLFEGRKETIAFISLLNDKISREETGRGKLRTLAKGIPHPKRTYRSFPAVKIGRMGVNIRYQRKGMGTEILDAVKASFTTANKTGCRFVTVDAYNNPCTIGFYQKNGFNFLTEKDHKDDTRLMYFDLKRFIQDNS